MIVYTNLSQLPIFNNAVLTIGTFDGVHFGHQQILELMKSAAKQVKGETVIITFNPHPRKIIGTHKAPLYLLNTLEEKINLLENYGIDHLVIVPFTEKFALQPAEDYIAEFLVNTFHPHTIIIGHDHRFGKDRAGDFQLLKDKAPRFGYEVKEIPGYMLHDITISSTKIREALLNGDIATAHDLLGYDYFFTGKVVKGNQLGRTIGFPTANLQIADENKLIPGNGVYTVTVTSEKLGIHGRGAMMNIGFRPTVNGNKRIIEVNIFAFDQNIYDESLRIGFKKYLRAEQKFSGLEPLKEQLAKDKQAALQALQNGQS
jgi:riboflavin kinase/FMN adenylyltransferase